MKEVRKETPLQWFSDHPIVSTVLWILGHNMSRPLIRKDLLCSPYSPTSGTKSPGLLSWKDDHGGNIAEYIHEVQNQTNGLVAIDLNDSMEMNKKINVNPNRRIKLNNPKKDKKEMKLNNSNGEQVVKINGSADCTPSPQWGFYLNITPPDSEK
jgi:hypothetical protein